MRVRALVRVAVVQRPDDAVSELARLDQQFGEALVGSHRLGQGAASVEMLEPVEVQNIETRPPRRQLPLWRL